MKRAPMPLWIVMACAILLARPAAASDQIPIPPEARAAWTAKRYAQVIELIDTPRKQCQASGKGGACLELMLFHALALIEDQRYPEAETALRDAMTLSDQAFGAGSDQSMMGGLQLTKVLMAQGKIAVSIPVFERVLPVLRRRMGDGARFRIEYVSMYSAALLATGNRDKAVAVLDELVEQSRAAGAADSMVRAMLTRAEIEVTDPLKAEVLKRRILASPQFAQTGDAALKIRVMSSLAKTLYALDNIPEAYELSQAIVTLAGQSGIATKEVDEARRQLAAHGSSAKEKLGQDARQACAQAEKAYGAQSYLAVYHCLLFATDLLFEPESFGEGAQFVRRYHGISEKLSPDSSLHGVATSLMAFVSQMEGRDAQAHPLYRKGLPSAAKALGDTNYALLVLKAAFAFSLQARPETLPEARTVSLDILDRAIAGVLQRPSFDRRAMTELKKVSPLVRLTVKVNWRLYEQTMPR